jgi:hypothetical protein
MHDPLKLVPRACRRGIIGSHPVLEGVDTLREQLVLDEQPQQIAQFIGDSLDRLGPVR